MIDRTRAEIRFEVPILELSVLDGYCQATGKDRTTMLREILGAWSLENLHVATLICRVVGVNPMAPDGGRHD